MKNLISLPSDRSAPLSTRTLSNRLVAVTFASLGLLGFEHACATSTYAGVRAQLSGLPTVMQESEGGVAGAQASALLQSGSGQSFATGSSSAAASVGSVSVQTLATANTGADVDGTATAQCVDGFTIVSSGHPPGTMGTFNVAVSVSGNLLADVDRAIADSFVVGLFRLDTDVPNGNLSATEGGRRIAGVGPTPTFSGFESFPLVFENVPFMFGRPIGITLRLNAASKVVAFSNGGFGRAAADYGQSMTWAGMSNLRDAAGNSIIAFNAHSATSGFNFANATPVPEPGSVGLLLLGLCVVAWRMWPRPGDPAPWA